MALGQIVWPTFLWVMVMLVSPSAPLSTLSQTLNERENSDDFIPNSLSDLRMEDIMHQINRFKRAAKS